MIRTLHAQRNLFENVFFPWTKRKINAVAFNSNTFYFFFQFSIVHLLRTLANCSLSVLFFFFIRVAAVAWSSASVGNPIQSSTYCTSREWLFELMLPFYQLELVYRFYFTRVAPAVIRFKVQRCPSLCVSCKYLSYCFLSSGLNQSVQSPLIFYQQKISAHRDYSSLEFFPFSDTSL